MHELAEFFKTKGWNFVNHIINTLTQIKLNSSSVEIWQKQSCVDLPTKVLKSPVMGRVNRTVGNRSGLTGYRSNRSGPVPAGTQPAKIQILNLNSKNEKFPKKS